MKKYKSNVFFCFSPLVMFLTFAVEFVLAVTLLLKRRKTKALYSIIAILLLLSIFQLSEYAICESFGLNADAWGRIGFIAITLLPPVGFHLVYLLAGKRIQWPVWLAYGTAFSWILMFATNNIILNQVCTDNYLIFNMKENFGGAYFVYYYFWLLVAACTAFVYSRATKNKNQKSALRWFIIGYASFIVPATIIWTLSASASRGLPSIMCGFALTLAIILAVKVAPYTDRSNK